MTDVEAVRDCAQRYAAALAAGEFMSAGKHLSEDARATIGPVMQAMPMPLETAEVQDVRAEGEDCLVVIRYVGPATQITVESRWAERDGRPMIMSMILL